MRSKLESHIEKKCCQYAETLDYDHIKLDRAKRKWPDRLFVGPIGQILFVEFKRPGQSPRPQQAAFIAKLEERNHEIHVIDNLPDFQRIIDRL